MFKVNKNVYGKIMKSKMSYPESELDSNFDPASKSDSESDSESGFSLAVMNLDICIFFSLYFHFSK